MSPPCEQTGDEGLRESNGRTRQLDALRSEVKKGFDQLDHGQGIELDEAGLRRLFKDIQARGKQRYRAAKKSP